MVYISTRRYWYKTGDFIFGCGAGNNDTAKLALNYAGITSPLPINGVSQLKMSYSQNITSDVQQQLNNAVMFGDLSFNRRFGKLC